MNPLFEWIIEDVPQLRIIDDDLCQAVQVRHASIPRKWKSGESDGPFNQFRRPTYLFSGLTKCGECEAGAWRSKLACPTRSRSHCCEQTFLQSFCRGVCEGDASALQREDTGLEASEMLRGPINSTVLIPDEASSESN
jgi:hypothetical protein